MRAGEPQTCNCWPLVVGTLLITLGAVNLLFGLTATVVGLELSQVAQQVEGNSDAIDIGRAFRHISGGLLSVGDGGMGAQAQSLLKELPPPWVAGLLGVLRMSMAVVGIVLGALLTRRRAGVLRPTLCWSLGDGVLGIVAVVALGLPAARLIGGLGGWLVMSLDVALHIVWPAVVLAFMRRALARGDTLQC